MPEENINCSAPEHNPPSSEGVVGLEEAKACVPGIEVAASREALLEQIESLERKVEDAIDLLHMWKNEAYSYRWLVESVIDGRFPVAKARQALAKGMVQTDVEEMLLEGE